MDVGESTKTELSQKRKRSDIESIFQGEVHFVSNTHRLLYNELQKRQLLYDESVDFNSINHDYLKSVMVGAGLTRYLVAARHTKIQRDELSQFYAHLGVTLYPELVVQHCQQRKV